MTRSWWTTASTPARLVQIDAALSIGLTCEQARIICHCPNRSAFTSFCAYHGRRFGRDHASTNAKLSATNVVAMRRKRGLSELDRDEAFSVFDQREGDPLEGVFERVPA
ncbi:MAG: hypothetical protein DI589_11320 [Shinella sp.]|nr:MAG: hypothetical protein DI589_11320 [Shinella sp.]